MVNPIRKWKSKGKRKGKGKGKGKSKHLARTKKKSHPKKTKHPCAYGHVYSTECGHCINMQNDWDKLTVEVKKDNEAMELIDISQNHQEKVDAMNEMYRTDLKFNGFPTIFKLIKKNTPVLYYQGDRSKEDMKKWFFS